MPEGPEARLITEYLDSSLRDAILQTIIPNRPDYVKRHIRGDYRRCKEEMPLKILGVRCKGKFIWFELEENWYIFHNLGMTGTWLFSEPEDHLHLKLKTNRGLLYYQDVRRFGGFNFVLGESQLKKKLVTIGPDMMTDVDNHEFVQRVNKYPSRTIAQLLMDQTIVSGIGNYIKCEALYRAGISPHRTVESLTPIELVLIKKKVQQVMRASYKSQGASIRDYVLPDESKGSFAFEFLVYGREEDRRGNPVVKEPTQDGRSSWWVPSVQT
jgi:formamidopyrimidine-DNA glycosylase